MSTDITSTPASVPTLLTNLGYMNLTGRQVVEAVVIGENVVLYSGGRQSSIVTQAVRTHTTPLATFNDIHIHVILTHSQDLAFTGSVIHIIDTVLTLPSVLQTATAAT
jgi:hypothetical protein